MRIIEFIRLVRKHLVLLLIVPLLLAGLVVMLTSKPSYSYTSQTVLYTGLATGSTIEMDKTFNYFLTNTAFDNLLNIINSRETQQEVAIRLLSQHLLLAAPDPKYISEKSFAELKRITPAYIYKFVARGYGGDVSSEKFLSTVSNNEASPLNNQKDSSAVENDSTKKNVLFPATISHADFERTIRNLTVLMKGSDTNFVYRLLNFEDPHYSIKAISTIKAQRIANSDLIKLSYEVDDPGICQQTLAIFNEVCIENYKNIKENRSDEVVKYFEAQLTLANQRLKLAEDKLLIFNKSNNIINYYEQSKAVAVVKEDMEVDYNNKKAQLAGHQAAIRRLEQKLDIQQLVQLKSNTILEKKKTLGDVNYELAMAEAQASTTGASSPKLQDLKRKSEMLKSDIKKSVDTLYKYQNSVEGLPVNTVLNDWIDNVIEAESLQAKLTVMDQRNKDFQQQYSIYAPAGANIKRIEREISVSEQGYLELLHGLNLAKLKLQDNELASDLKAVDPPYYPLTPSATKRKVLIIASALFGGIVVLAIVLIMEYLDNSMRNQKKAEKILNMTSLGMMPKAYLKPGIASLPNIQNRLLEIICQNINQTLSPGSKGLKTIIFLSTMTKEGKTVMAGSICRKFKEEGKKILFLNCSGKLENLSLSAGIPWFSRLLGYQDPRMDYNNCFLESPSRYLNSSEYFNCEPCDNFFTANSYLDILEQNNIKIDFVPDYVFIELPAVLTCNYPASIIATADLNILVCRSNRLWSDADQTVLNGILPLADTKIKFIANGVELQEVEALLGELPKKRSWLRRKIKTVFRFQFFSKNHF